MNITKSTADKFTRNKGVINAPKNNVVSTNCQAIKAIASQGTNDGALTPLGHKGNCKGGVIDTALLNGATCLNDFVQALLQSGLKGVVNDRQKFGTATCQAVLAKRVVDHVQWCATTTNNTHGGFGSRLNKVGLIGQRGELAGLMGELAGQLKKTFTVQHASLFKARNTTGLK